MFVFIILATTIVSADQTDETYNHDSGFNTSNTTIIVRPTDEDIQYSWYQHIIDVLTPRPPYYGCSMSPSGEWLCCPECLD